MSDFNIHKTCETYRCIEHLALDKHLLCDSGMVSKWNQNTLPPEKLDNKMTVNAFHIREVPTSWRPAPTDEGAGRQGPHLLPGGNQLNY